MKFEYKELSVSELTQHIIDNIKSNGKCVNDLYYHDVFSNEFKKSTLSFNELFYNIAKHDTKYFTKVEIEETYSVGDRFEFQGTIKGTYILAQLTNSEVVLISLTDGNLWAPPKSVKNSKCITKEEFDNITINTSYNFKKLDKV